MTAASKFGAPLEIKRVSGSGETGAQRGDGISVSWGENANYFYSSELLRKSCPCATCREARGEQTHDKPLLSRKQALRVLKASSDEETDLRNIWVVGNYAIGMEWGDRHNSGIYTFEYLCNLPGVKN